MSAKRVLRGLLGNATERRRSLAIARGALRGWTQGRRAFQVVALTQHIGDLVAAEPVARYLDVLDPNWPVTWVVRRDLQPLVACFPTVGRIITVDSLSEWAGMRKTLRGGIDLHVSGSWCDRHGGKVQRPGCPVTRENYYAHGPLLTAFANSGGLPPPETWGIDLTPHLVLPAAATAEADALNLPNRFLAFHCRSNQASRDWTDEKWRSLARRMIDETRLPVVEVGLTAVCDGVDGVINACGRTSLLGTAAVIARAALFVGIDSGPAHFANAARVPGVILLGRYAGFDRYLPYSGHFADGGAAVIQHDRPVAGLGVDEAFAACLEQLHRGAAAA